MRAPVLAVALLAFALTACVSIGNGESPVQTHYGLRDATSANPQRRAEPLVGALLLQPLPADALADTASIAYSRREGEYAFYQLATWTERPVRQLPRLLQQRLEARGVARAVGLLGEPLGADWLVTIGIDALYHDVRVAPGQARLALTLELFDRRHRNRVARQAFEATVATERADSAAAAAAMSGAVAQLFDAAVPWLETELQRALAAASAASAPK